MIEYQHALQRVLDCADCSQSTEILDLIATRGRIAASDQVSPIAVPVFANSAMDGYAVQSQTVVIGQKYRVSQRIAAGDLANELEVGTVARIFTGAMVPNNADAVIVQEDSIVSDEPDGVVFHAQPRHGENVRLAGEDIKKNDTLMCSGERIEAKHLGLLASVGISKIACYKPLRVAFFSTGDELVEPGRQLHVGQIYNSNRMALVAEMQSLGIDVVDMGTCPDSAVETEKFLREASGQADCVITTGGMSVGEADYVAEQLSRLGDIEFWKVAIKPGKPLAFGSILGAKFFGLPGNPVSAFVTFQLFVRPWLLKKGGHRQWQLPSVNAIADFKFSNNGERTNFLRGKYQVNEEGRMHVSIFPKQGSGVFSSVTYGNALVPIAMNTGVEVGELCQVLLL